MKWFKEAYQHYMKKCHTYGIDGMDFQSFMKNMTIEQAKKMLQEIA